MEGSQELKNLVDALTSVDLWQAIFVFTVGFILINIFKDIATNIFNYILVHVEFGIGSHIEFKGIRGVISEMGISRVKFKLDNENSYMYIRNTDRKFMTLIVPSDSNKLSEQ